MNVFICSDIEGTAGFTSIDEGTLSHPEYGYFREQMTREVSAACSGAISSGADKVLVKDAHGTARNIIPSQLPEKVRIVRGNTNDIYAMMSGLQEGNIDVAIFTGFHSGASDKGSPVSHTFNRKTDLILLNGMLLNEFLYNTYTAAYFNVPVAFISGDLEVCNFAKKIIQNITTVPTLVGYSGATISIHPELAVRQIEAGVQNALSGRYHTCLAKLPDTFTMEIRFSNHQDAYFNSFYPGIIQQDSKSLVYTTNNWNDILCMVHFVLDK